MESTLMPRSIGSSHVMNIDSENDASAATIERLVSTDTDGLPRIARSWGLAMMARSSVSSGAVALPLAPACSSHPTAVACR
ncbi:hypothetical protein D3C71_1585730 [compost metagenome]